MWSSRVHQGVKARPPTARQVVRELRSAPPRCGAPSTQTVRSLASGASCTPWTRFQADGLAGHRPPDPRGPAPHRVALVVAGRVVHERLVAVHRPLATAHADVAARPHAARACSSRCNAPPLGEATSTPGALVEREVDAHVPGVHPRPPGPSIARRRARRRSTRGACRRAGPPPTSAGGCPPTRASPTQTISVRPVEADVAPALERAPAPGAAACAPEGASNRAPRTSGPRTGRGRTLGVHSRLTGQSTPPGGGRVARRRRSAQLDRRQGSQPRDRGPPCPRRGRRRRRARRAARRSSTCAARTRTTWPAPRPLDGPTVGWARDIARELGIDLVAGSFVERREGRDKLSNTSVHVGPDGELKAVYRKIHMFDVEVGGHGLPRVRVPGAGRRARGLARPPTATRWA